MIWPQFERGETTEQAVADAVVQKENLGRAGDLGALAAHEWFHQTKNVRVGEQASVLARGLYRHACHRGPLRVVAQVADLGRR